MVVLGAVVLCVYHGIFQYHPSKEEYAKSVGIYCKIVELREAYDDASPEYRHIKIDCTKALKPLRDSGELSPNKFNWDVGWRTTDDCYEMPKEHIPDYWGS